MVRTAYNSSVRENRGKNYLAGYRMSTLLSDRVTEAATLEQNNKTIPNSPRRCPALIKGMPTRLSSCEALWSVALRRLSRRAGLPRAT